MSGDACQAHDLYHNCPEDHIPAGPDGVFCVCGVRMSKHGNERKPVTCKWPGHENFTPKQRRQYGCIERKAPPWCDEHKMNHPDTSEHFRMKDNDEVRNGHRAGACPKRVDVQTWGDHGKPHYIHGDCMPYLSDISLPTVTTEDGKVTVVVQDGEYQEMIYTGYLVSSEIRQGLDNGSEVRLTLVDTTREIRAVHADPHYIEVPRHGKFCLCGCKTCTFEGEDGSLLCNDMNCSC